MIKQKLKECSDCGRETQIWSKGRCRICDARFKASQASYSGLSPSRYTKTPLNPKTALQAIKSKSKKRIEEEKEYKKICDEMDERKPWKCFFCSLEIKGKRVDHHHIGSRAVDYLTPGLIVHAHRKCHSAFHDTSFSKLPWRYAYLQRLRMKGEQLYQREKMKLDK